MTTNLAIVIPCYKGYFLKDTLESIAHQTNSNFNLYIGIDDSPEDIESIISKIAFTNKIIVKRFNENFGSKSLTKAWQRCIDLSANEEYVWLFSDDDVMPNNAVERFYNTVNNQNIDLLRFPLQVIDQDGLVLRKNPSVPLNISSLDYLISKLSGEITSAAIEYIFRKEHFKLMGGFEDFPVGWCSDDATWAKLGQQNGILLIRGNPISWRNADGINISNKSTFNREKISATILFYQWIYSIYGNKKILKSPTYKFAKTILKASVNYDYSLDELYKICVCISKFSKFNSIRLFLKLMFKSRKQKI